MYHHEYNNRVRELFEEKQVQMAKMIKILKMLDEPNFRRMLHLLDVIFEKSPADNTSRLAIHTAMAPPTLSPPWASCFWRRFRLLLARLC